MDKTCPECNITFTCDSRSNHACWCDQYPAVLPLYPNNGCLCPDCLKKKANDVIENHVAEVKAGKAELIDSKYHGKGLVEGIDYYIEGEGYVFKEWYLLKRGKCCGNGCRHCPYPLK